MGAFDKLAEASDKIAVEHVLILSTTTAWEETIRRAIKTWGDSSRETVGVFKIIGYGLATYLVLCGVSRVIESLQGKRGDHGGKDSL
jgi:hypothetical protein